VTEHEDTFYTWDVRGLPDGHYRVRLTVDDARDNGDGTALRDRRSSPLFVVDNTPPALGEPVTEREGAEWIVRFDARDPGGVVAFAEAAVDGEEWRPIVPRDGVADSERERYEVRFPALGGRERTLRVRISDDAGNLASDAWRVADR
jgi:hypothetical protein